MAGIGPPVHPQAIPWCPPYEQPGLVPPTRRHCSAVANQCPLMSLRRGTIAGGSIGARYGKLAL
jgi:hypothetical protein